MKKFTFALFFAVMISYHILAFSSLKIHNRDNHPACPLTILFGFDCLNSNEPSFLFSRHLSILRAGLGINPSTFFRLALLSGIVIFFIRGLPLLLGLSSPPFSFFSFPLFAPVIFGKQRRWQTRAQHIPASHPNRR